MEYIDIVNFDNFQVGMLQKIMKELKTLVHELINHEVNISNSGIEKLEAEAHHSREKAEAVSRTLKTKEEELKRATDQINLLKGEVICYKNYLFHYFYHNSAVWFVNPCDMHENRGRQFFRPLDPPF